MNLESARAAHAVCVCVLPLPSPQAQCVGAEGCVEQTHHAAPSTLQHGAEQPVRT